MKKENKLIAWFKNFNEKHKKLCEIARFVIVGGIATVIDLFVMGLVLYAFEPALYPKFYNIWIGGGDPSTLATVIGTGTGFVVSLVFNYILSVLFVYEDKGNSKSVKGAILFAVFSIIGMLINMGGMWLGYDVCGINEWVTKIIMTLVVLVYNYTTRKLFIFKKEKPQEVVND
ncbi:MAG: GtrA family protein [Clostridia bacterium]|nr:GtrA family protein [Clostridia bacterium]